MTIILYIDIRQENDAAPEDESSENIDEQQSDRSRVKRLLPGNRRYEIPPSSVYDFIYACSHQK